nr:E3 ubiquitin-protein ligase KEG [Tanacetum cinerariifolium]
DDEGHNAFHMANDTTRKMRENLDWIILMLKYPRACGR